MPPRPNSPSTSYPTMVGQGLSGSAAAAGVKPGVLVYYSVTRNQDRHAVLPIRPADRPLGPCRFQGQGDVLIRTRRPVGNAQQLLPHGGLKRAAGIDHGNAKLRTLAGEVLRQL